MTTDVDGRIPITIVTGFLGSGKTTLIRRLLAAPAFANTAIIVNELGEVGIDHHLFHKTDERITLLADGCACCARRDDLVTALGDQLRRIDRDEPPRVNRVILETTGLANPAPIQHTIAADPLLSRRYRVDRVITSLDAVAGAGNLSTFSEAVQQLTAADVVVITKTDLAPDAAAALAALVTRVNPAAAIHTSLAGNVDAEVLLDDTRRSAAPERPSTPGSDRLAALHAPGGIASLSMEFSEPLDWRMLGLWLTMLLHSHGARVLRVKGLLDIGEAGPLLLEGVQHVVHAPRHLAQWPPGERHSRLVFIIRDLEPERIRESLTAFQDLAARR